MRYSNFYFEVVVSLVLVTVLTIFTYHQLAGIELFWSAQAFWSYVLIAGWIIVASGYYHQGYMVRKDGSASHVSVILPIAVFCVQLVLFIKGIHFHDWSLIGGAVMVNSGVLFSLTQILRSRMRKR